MSGPQFFQTIMGRQFFDVTMPRLAKAAERIADELEASSQEANKAAARDKSIIRDMATSLFDANEEPDENPEYLRGQLELMCSAAEVLATKETKDFGLGEQREAMEALFRDSLTRGLTEGGDRFAAAVVDFYFED